MTAATRLPSVSATEPLGFSSSSSSLQRRIEEERRLVEEAELTECDRSPLHEIAYIQQDVGHVLFVEYPSFLIVAHDAKLHELPFIGGGSADSSGGVSGATQGPSKRMKVTAEDGTTTAAATTATGAGDDSSIETESHRRFMGTNLRDWIDADLFATLQNAIDSAKKTGAPRNFLFHNCQDQAYGISLSSTTPKHEQHTDTSMAAATTIAAATTVIGIEIEEIDAQESSSQLSTTLISMGRVVESLSNDRIAETACDTIFDLLSPRFDRGMVYKFHDDLSGEVIHEVKNDSVKSSYKGMRFPKGDIPLNARKLFIENGLRYIANVKSADVPVISSRSSSTTTTSGSNHNHRYGPFDLTQIRMRACHKSHILYLQNMGVVSTMSIAIVVEDALWGLMVFHAYQRPFHPSLQQRIALETIGTIVSVRLEAHIKKTQSARVVQLSQVLLQLHAESSVIQNLYEWGEQLLGICDADIVMGHVQDPREGEGDEIVFGRQSLVPSSAFWTTLMTHPERELLVVSTAADIRALGLSHTDCPASGFVFFRQGRTALFLGRDTRCHDVHWGGNPDQPKLVTDNGILGPRQSFDLFIEKAKQESKAWSAQDIHVISVVRDRLCEHSYTYTMDLLKQDIETTNKKYLDAMDRARDNYEFFAHMSHELRTPFHGVMGCLSILQESMDDITSEEAKDVVKTAITSGDHMINLLNDILDIAKKKHMSHVCAKNKLIYQSFAYETIDCMRSLASSRNTKLDYEISGPSSTTSNSLAANINSKIVIVTDRTKVTQIVSNMVNNAIKFTGDGGIQVNFRLVPSLAAATGYWIKDAQAHAGAVLTFEEGEMMSSIKAVQEKVAEYEFEYAQAKAAAANGVGTDKATSKGKRAETSTPTRTASASNASTASTTTTTASDKQSESSSSSPPKSQQRWLAVAVADTGCGIKPAELASMFAPYTQSSNGSSRAFQGTGLGLYICVSLCRQLNGYIGCTSTPGLGTTFHFAIPVDCPEESNNTTTGSGTDANEASPSSVHPDGIVMKGPILIVDDNKVNVKILLRSLQLELKKANLLSQVSILTAFGGKEAVQVYQQNHPSLCIIDYHMPEVDGVAATKQIRDYEQMQSLPPARILSYTADATERATKAIIESGANEMMSKPPPKGFINGLVSRLVIDTAVTSSSTTDSTATSAIAKESPADGDAKMQALQR